MSPSSATSASAPSDSSVTSASVAGRSAKQASEQLSPFVGRHIGPRSDEIQHMLRSLGFESLEALTAAVVPANILELTPIELPSGVSEQQALAELRAMAARNQVLRSFIGQGYYGTHVPPVIQRNVLENPGWYTAYTPYQPEISQGRLEVLFYFQTLVCELTGMDIAGASLLDEATAAAEAMTLGLRHARPGANRILVSTACHPQTIAMIHTRAQPLGVEIVQFDERQGVADWQGVFALLVQYPASDGRVEDCTPLLEQARSQGVRTIVASDLLALMLLKNPGAMGADVVIGSAQRFGVPLGFGGPHAAFLATRDAYKRSLPGRLVGQTIDTHGQPAYRLALQTREQHIRREKATSNICTAQALLAIMSTLYAMYHGPEGLQAIAARVHKQAKRLATALSAAGYQLRHGSFFDTLAVHTGAQTAAVMRRAVDAGYNLRGIDQQTIGIALDETTTEEDLHNVAQIFGAMLMTDDPAVTTIAKATPVSDLGIGKQLLRQDQVLTQPAFHAYRSETEMMRYLRRLAEMDIALDRAMIPLGSCTMKLNAAAELSPVSWPEFSHIHPLAPADQSAGYRQLVEQLESMLCAITGYAAVSLQPNAGSQGEYAGLLAIRQYHQSRGDGQRDICLIPSSAHGTNPASAQMCNMRVQVVQCDAAGNVDLTDLDAKIAAHSGRIAAIMLTYPSTHGVFEEGVRAICDKVHAAGGQVYIDGANLNALVGLAKPGSFGGDVSHLNLHKTFCIPHGGGGPGIGPVAVRAHLAPYLPRDGRDNGRGGPMVSAAAFGSAGILPISWMYIRMMGAAGLRRATQVAILSANYIAQQLKSKYQVLFTGRSGLVAHECILDTRPLQAGGLISVDDLAKRLIDYGFHAPTMSFPVAGTLMIEPTESESLAELDRFIRAMLSIYSEYEQVRDGVWPKDNNPLRGAPHTLQSILDDSKLAYPKRLAVCPDPHSDYRVKYFPPVGRVDNVYGDRNLVCACPPPARYEE
ncbi:MAG: aminomethyl-transferring glycine dehydrogenase [Pirellulaceae bacterium]|nr:aminomethyl-transferring glycine dehydrogenase [Pirellulaceae bacterium]